jgi:hypothetical protein
MQTCTACFLGFKLWEGVCQPECPVGGTDGSRLEGGTFPFFDTAVGREVCHPCGEHCAFCFDEATCFLCQDRHYLLEQSSCVPTCPAGYIARGEGSEGRECIRCPDECEACTLTRSGPVCTV